MYKVPRFFVTGVVISLAVAAHAAPNMPRRAKTLRVELVRAYAACNGVPTPLNHMNGIRDTDWVACTADTPLSPLSTFKFGPQGHGDARAVMAANGDSMDVRFDLTDVQDSNGTAVDGAIFTLEFTYRMTTNHCDFGNVCTATDITNGVTATCKNGNCHGHSRIGLTVVGEQTFPVSLEIQPMEVADPTGAPFAVQGIVARHNVQ